MTERTPSFGPMPEAEEFSADVLPEFENIEPQLEQNPFDESLLSSVIESATEQPPMEQTLDMANEGVVQPQKQPAAYQPMQSVGSILGQVPAVDQPKSVNPNNYSSGINSRTIMSPRPTATVVSVGLTYRQAVKYGILAAIFIAAIIAVATY